MSEKRINKSPISYEVESKSPLPQHEGRLGVGIIPQGYKQTSIGTIPQDWEVVRLGEVGDIVGGGTPDTTNPAFWNGEILWLTPTEIKQKYISTSERKITQKGLENSSAKILPKNTILITTRATIGDIGIATKQLCTNQGFQSFVSGKNANFEFMYYLLCAKRSQFISLANGSTFLEVSAKTMRQIQIPLPPLKEQEKIARILGVWDSAIDSLANLIKAKRKYKTALMQRLLTPPRYTTSCHTDALSCHTERSEVSKSKSVDFMDTSAFSKPQYDKVLDSCNDDKHCHTASPTCHTEGVARSIQKDDLQGNDICLDSSLSAKAQNDKEKNAENGREINPQNDKENTHNDKKKIRESSLRFAGFSDKWQEFRLGDIGEIYQPQTIPQSDFTEMGYNVYGANGIIGKYHSYNHEKAQIAVACRGNSCGAVNFTIPKSWITGNAMVINLDNSKAVDKIFAYYTLLNSNLNYLITGSGQPQITGNIKNHKIKLPTLAEQKKIAQVLSACDKEIETLNLKFECLKAQKRGLMQQLLSGKVRVKC